ncbi:MAG TPA: outer membrane beta-barrel protein [Thermoanaerobaculia bacterium]
MPVWKRLISFAALACAASAPLFAQGLPGWRIGAAAGVVNDVKGTFRIEGFDHYDFNIWGDYVTDEKVAIRAMIGQMKVRGSQSGDQVSLTPGGPTVTLPEFTDRINYGTIGASYEYFEGDFTSGLFAGIGVYRVKPDALDPTYQAFQDPSHTAFGWHFGADASFRIVSKLSLLVRLTYHYTTVDPRRQLLSATGGFMYRF